MQLRQGDLPDPRPGAAGEQADVGRDRVEADGDTAQGAMGGDHAVHGPLSLEVVVGLTEGQVAARGEPGDDPAGELGMGVDPGAHGGTAESQLAELLARAWRQRRRARSTCPA